MDSSRTDVSPDLYAQVPMCHMLSSSRCAGGISDLARPHPGPDLLLEPSQLSLQPLHPDSSPPTKPVTWVLFNSSNCPLSTWNPSGPLSVFPSQQARAGPCSRRRGSLWITAQSPALLSPPPTAHSHQHSTQDSAEPITCLQWLPGLRHKSQGHPNRYQDST